MGTYTDKNLFSFMSEVDLFIKNKSKILDNPDLDKIFADYNELIAVADPIEKQIESAFCKFQKYITKTALAKIDTAIKKHNLSNLINYISIAIRTDLKNIKLLEKLSSAFKENFLYSELSEIYKMLFIYTSNINYLEKIGDFDYKNGKYESALDNYLGFAEISDPNPRIYKKMAKVFGKLGDNDSKSACLKQVKILEDENG